MSSNVQNTIIHFITSGLLFSIVFYGIDYSEGLGFDPVKFIFRFFAFGAGMVLARIISKEISRRVSKKNPV